MIAGITVHFYIWPNLFMYKTILLVLFVCTCLFSKAQSDSITVTTEAGSDSVPVFQKVEVEAQFPGGLPAWRTYLTQNMRMDKIVAAVPKRTKHWEQQAIVQFIVGKDGTISQIKVINNVNPQVAKEARRIMAASPRWEPAMQNGRPVRAYRKQPITFMVDGE